MNIDDDIRHAPENYREALIAEKQTYERIHETAKAVLAEVGVETRTPRIIQLLEDTGLAGYDGSLSRIYLLPELIDQSLASAAKTFTGDEWPNTLGVGGIPPFLYRVSAPRIGHRSGAFCVWQCERANACFRSVCCCKCAQL